MGMTPQHFHTIPTHFAATYTNMLCVASVGFSLTVEYMTRRVYNIILLYESSPFKVVDGLVSKLGVHVVRPQPGDNINVGRVVAE